jgi:hypothetical protein
MITSNWIKRIAAVGLILSIGSCTVPDAAPSPYESGAYVVNAGSIPDNNGSISFLSRRSNTVSTDIFNAANAQPLNGSVQDYTEIDGKGVILVNNTGLGKDRIEIVESGTFKLMTTLSAPDLENPRYVVKAGRNKAYVSCWDTTGAGANAYPRVGYILVLDLASRTVFRKIPVTKGAERMVVVGNEVFVGSAGGERVIAVINTDTDEVKEPGISVGVNANPIAVDANGKLWAYASSSNEMIRINPVSKLEETRFKIGNSPKMLSSIALSADGKMFYFVNSFVDPADNKLKGETHRFSVNDTSMPGTGRAFINRPFSGLGVDPQTGMLYAGVSPSPRQAGYVLRYEAGGRLVDSVSAELVPTRFFFR